MSESVSSGSPSQSTFSLPALMVAGGGLALLFLRRTAEEWMEEYWTDSWTVAWLLIAAIALFWGITHSVQRLNPRRGATLLTRHRVALPRPGLVYIIMMIVMLSGSLLGKSNMLMLMFAMMAGPFVLNGWITFSMLRRIRVQRQVPRSVMAGEPAAIDLTLENRKLLITSWVMTVQDHLSNGRERLDPDVLFFRVPRRSSRHAAYQVRLMRRGRYTLGPMTIRTRFPLGLVERSVIVSNTDEILVAPRLGRLSPRWKRDHLLAAELVHQQKLKRGVFDDEFHSIREFRSGDNPRGIHWRTSARQNQLMVREYHQSRDRNLTVLVDLWIPSHPTDEDRRRVELAISFVATLCVEQMKLSRDSRIELGVAGQTFDRWEGRSGPVAIESLMELLAMANAGVETEWPRLQELASQRSSSVTRAVMVTTRDADRMSDDFARIWGMTEEGGADVLRDVTAIAADERSLEKIFTLE